MILDGEIWRQIDPQNVEPNEIVHVSNLGRLKSFKRNPENPRIIKGSFISIYNSIVLKQRTGAPKTYYVHKLVAEYFVEKKSGDLSIVIHLDHDSKNNRFDNLAWVTETEFYNHRINIPDYEFFKIKNNKLSEMQVVRIKRLLKSKVQQSRIAKEFGISEMQVSRIKNNKNWSHIIFD